MRKRNRFLLAACAALIALGGGYVAHGFRSSASADDPAHTTYFAIQEDPLNPGVQEVAAWIYTNDMRDTKADVEVSIYDPTVGGWRNFNGASMVRAEQPDPMAALAPMNALPLSGFWSGDIVKADFTTYDDGGNALWTFTRQLTIP